MIIMGHFGSEIMLTKLTGLVQKSPVAILCSAFGADIITRVCLAVVLKVNK